MDDLLGLPVHVPTLAVARGLVEIMLAMLLAFAGQRSADLRGANWWSLGFLVNAVSLLTFVVPDPAWARPSTIINHLSIGVADAALLIGYWQFSRHAIGPRQRALLAVIVTLPVLSLMFWEFLFPNAQFRILTSVTAHFVFYAALQSSLSRPGRPELAALCHRLRLMVIGYGLIALLSYVGLAAVLPTSGYVSIDYHRAMFSAATLLFMVGLAAGFLALQFAMLAARNADLAMSDPLTSLANRRGMQFHADRITAQLQRSGQPCAVIVLDIDHFKYINDQHGHSSGDRVICTVADVLKASARAGDVGVRLGGEEFGLVLPGTSLTSAMAVAERVRAACEQSPVVVASAVVRFTASLGVSELGYGESLFEALDRADEALYDAKGKGRNRVELRPVPASVVAARASGRATAAAI